MLSQLGVIPIILGMISNESEINNEIILFGVVSLLGGNVVTQTDFLNYFIEDVENVFLQKIYDIIDGNFILLKKLMDKKNKNFEDKEIDKIDKIKIYDNDVENNNFKNELIDLGFIEVNEENEDENIEFEEMIVNIKNCYRSIKKKLN